VRLSLKPHPSTPFEAGTCIEVELDRPSPQALRLTYEVRADLERVLVPVATKPARARKLWEHCCFEAFIRPGEGQPYWEFNFAPSGEWAAYRLSSHRAGMAEAEQPEPPRIATRATGDLLQVYVDFQPGLPVDLSWKVGLSAVIEDREGQRSFWALAHPPGEPDFHSPDCFALELAPPPLP
jgi:hypothetical protein